MNRKEPAVNRENLEEIGELLFELLTADISEVQRQMGWIIFERELRQYYSKRRNNRFAIEKLAGQLDSLRGDPEKITSKATPMG
jgi:hypothetical protein